MNNLNRYEPGLAHRNIYRGIAGTILGGIIGALSAKPVMTFFSNFAPWVGPAMIIALVGLAIITMLLLPLILRRATEEGV